ncbi:MAG: NAD-dependent DNA ligase LigA [Pseudomonadota bacterium]|nr:NAD-dependent DNA ligase LigA [Pseudomonadota bacterium]
MDAIKALAAKVAALRKAYYQGKPLVADVEYDELERQLRELDPTHALLQKVGHAVDTTKTSAMMKVKHATPMLSLQKTYALAELLAWQKGMAIVGTHKIDGISLALIYQDGKLITAKTRGDGLWGENVTHKALAVPDIPKIIKHPAYQQPEAEKTAAMPAQKTIEIRGELCCSLPNFLRLAQAMQELKLPKPTSPRNVVAGMLGRNEHHELARFFNFFAYNLLDDDVLELKTEEMKLTRLGELGFSLPYPELLISSADINSYLQRVRQAMSEDEYGIDGAVFAINDLAHAAELGDTAHHPRSKMSFKWQGETAVAKVLAIDWDVSRNGVITPVAQITSTTLSNAVIQRVTLHNASFVQLHGVRGGDHIRIVRSGEVIPKFLAIEQRADATKDSVDLPTHCPCCGEELKFDGVRLLCDASTCAAQVLLAILHWLRCVGVKDLGKERLQMLIDRQLVCSIPDLYRLRSEDLLPLPMMKEKLATKLIANLQQSKHLTTDKFLHGLGIQGCGATTWRDLLRHGYDLNTILKLTVAELTAIAGFAEKSATQLVQGLQAKSALIAELLACGFKFTDAEQVSQTLHGKVYVISGSMSKARSYYQQLIVAHGGSLSSSVSGNTTALITNNAEANTSKVKAAKKHGVAIIDEEMFLQTLAERDGHESI